MVDRVMYNRGVLWAALHVEATRNAIKANDGKPPTGEEVKNGFEQIHDFGLGGVGTPLKGTAAGRPGGRVVQIFQVHGGEVGKETARFLAHPEIGASAGQESQTAGTVTPRDVAQ